MNPLTSLFAPLLAVLPVVAAPGSIPEASTVTEVPSGAEAGMTVGYGATVTGADGPDPVTEPQLRTFRDFARAARANETANQVRIEQRIIIRIAPSPAPRSPMPPPLRDPRRSLFADMPGHGGGSHLEERRMTQCVPVAGISGVQADGKSKLMLFMRDSRIVSASLEKACNARDFYSGFLVERSTDGMICAGRDKLLSRSGSNCALGALRQLIEVDDDE